MANWLARAHAIFEKTPPRPTANTDETSLSAVTAVPRLGVSGILDDSAASFAFSPTSPPSQLPKLTKPRSVSSVSAQGECISANDDALVDPGMEARRQRVLELLAANPGFRYAVVTDTKAEPEVVVVHIGIRGIGSGEIVIAKGRYDGIELLRALENREAE